MVVREIVAEISIDGGPAQKALIKFSEQAEKAKKEVDGLSKMAKDYAKLEIWRESFKFATSLAEAAIESERLRAKQQGLTGDAMPEMLKQVDAMAESFKQLEIQAGLFILDALGPLMKLAKPVIKFFTDGERGAARVKIALLLITPAIGVGLVGAIYAAATAFGVLEAITSPVTLVVLAIAAAVTALYLVFEDLWVFMQGGDSAFGQLLQWLGLSSEEIARLQEGLQVFWGYIQEAWEAMQPFMPILGKILIAILAVSAAGFVIPALVIPAIILGIALLYARWNRVVAAFMRGFQAIKKSVVDVVQTIASGFTSAFNYLLSIPGMLASKFFSAVQAMGAALLNLIPEEIKNLLGRGIKLIANFAGIEGFASGGPVSGGTPILVGERGPEIFTPPSAGQIVPNHALGGGGTTIGSLVGSINITVNGPEEAAGAVESAIMNVLNKLAQTVFRAEVGLAA